jgi:hypothetical protein
VSFSSSNFTTSSCPFSATHDSGVRPFSSSGLSQLFCSRGVV